MGGAGPDNGADTWSLASEEMHLMFFLVPPPQQLMSFAALNGTPGF